MPSFVEIRQKFKCFRSYHIYMSHMGIHGVSNELLSGTTFWSYVTPLGSLVECWRADYRLGVYLGGKNNPTPEPPCLAAPNTFPSFSWVRSLDVQHPLGEKAPLSRVTSYLSRLINDL